MRNPPLTIPALLLTLPWAATVSAASPAVAVHMNVWSNKGAVTLIDTDSFAVIGTAEFDQPVMPLRFDATRKSLLAFTASPWKKKAPVTLWSLDTETAAKTSVAELGRGFGSKTYLLDPGPSSTRLYVVNKTKKSKPATIAAFDLATLTPLGQLASVERLTQLRISPDGALLYAFCEGKPHKKPKGPPGNVHVLDAMTGEELGRVEAGQGASSLAFDMKRGLAYVLGVADVDENGTLTVLRGGAQAARFAVRGRPIGLKVGPDGVSYLLTSSAVIALDADGLAAVHTWKLSFGPSDLIFDPAHDVMFAGAGAGSKVAKLRIREGDVLVEHPTGDPGRKFGMGLGATLYFIFAVAAAAGGAYVPTPFLPVQNSTSMLLGEDGAILYVLNPYTSDVSIFDVAKQDVVDIVNTGGGSTRIVQLPRDPTFWVQSREKLMHFDTATNRIDRTIDFKAGISYNTVTYEAARERAWVTTHSKVLIFDLRTGEAVGKADLPRFATAFWIDNSRKPEPDSPHY